ncbi:NAD-P-binding protein [Cylindrobasidium torrendii FP15055 ss-10]|uniref:NAD-P-binding protein n=1 Tax=Cylindrobasidium torrendii FP15055 ss-10 TaxID=1314674 RepID=A0A0D7B9N6_9AGAR|nr:NAD-P-binding protein [Cylindrobasidium torrendii FP15055 ss-10]
MPAGETVLISGINGFVATDIALAFLKAGYHVRGTVRSQAKADAWLALPAFKEYAESGQVKIVLVKDITVEDAFVGAPLEGVDYFVHTIAQLPDWRPGVKQNYETDILLPNINGTLNALKCAAKYPQCKKVLNLGSIAGAVDFSVPKHDQPISGRSWNPRDYEYGKNAPHPLLAYTTSKKLADEAAWKYMDEVKPHFAHINMLPCFIYGPAHGHDPFGVHNASQQWLAGPLFRKDWNFKTASGGPVVVDLRDLCTAFVKAAERDEANGHRFALGPSNTTIFPSDYVALYAKAFPDRVEKLPAVPNDLENAPVFVIDSSETERLLDMKFRPAEETILDTARWLIESGAEKEWEQLQTVY